MVPPKSTETGSRSRFSVGGPLLMVAATLMFVIMVATVKVARQELTAFEVIFWRSIFALPITFLLARPKGGVRIVNRRVMALRAVLGFCAMSCFFTAAKGLALADLSILAKLQPLIIAIVAPLVLGRGESSGPLIWAILAIGLVGSGLLIGPELAIGGTYGLWALGAALFSALAHTMIRALGKTDHAAAIVFWFQLTTLVLAVVAFALVEGDLIGLPPSHLWPYLVGTGLAATAGQVLMTNAYRMEKASVIAAASYAGPLWAVTLDLFAFGVFPSGWALIGGALVLGAGLTLVLTTRQPQAPVESGVPAAAE